MSLPAGYHTCETHAKTGDTCHIKTKQGTMQGTCHVDIREYGTYYGNINYWNFVKNRPEYSIFTCGGNLTPVVPTFSPFPTFSTKDMIKRCAQYETGTPNLVLQHGDSVMCTYPGLSVLVPFACPHGDITPQQMHGIGVRALTGGCVEPTQFRIQSSLNVF